MLGRYILDQYIPVWILITLFAAVMQSVRTAGQKKMTAAGTGITPAAATYVRAVYGLPFAALYLGFVSYAVQQDTVQHGSVLQGLPDFNPAFFIYSLLAGLSQIAATVLLVDSFRFRSFAVATAYSKSEVLLTALAGSLLFATALSPLGWAGILVITLGLVLITLAKTGFSRSMLFEGSVLWGTGAGLGFALSGLFIKEATLALATGSLFLDAAWVLLVLLACQALILFVWLRFREPGAQAKLGGVFRLCWFVGLTSCLGSIGWFTAIALANPAYVRAVGQFEMVLALSVSAFVFREKLKPLEWAGVCVLTGGILAFFVLP